MMNSLHTTVATPRKCVGRLPPHRPSWFGSRCPVSATLAAAARDSARVTPPHLQLLHRHVRLVRRRAGRVVVQRARLEDNVNAFRCQLRMVALGVARVHVQVLSRRELRGVDVDRHLVGRGGPQRREDGAARGSDVALERAPPPLWRRTRARCARGTGGPRAGTPWWAQSPACALQRAQSGTTHASPLCRAQPACLQARNARAAGQRSGNTACHKR